MVGQTFSGGQRMAGGQAGPVIQFIRTLAAEGGPGGLADRPLLAHFLARRDEPACPEPEPALHEEVGRLPEKYRAAVVLCYLEGLTNEEAARRLRCPVGTVKTRLLRARDRLRDRLARRGLAPPAVLAVAAPAAI